MLGKTVKEMDLTEKMAFFEAYGAIAGAAGLKALSGMLLPRGLLKMKEPSETRACAAIALGHRSGRRGARGASARRGGQGSRGAQRGEPRAAGERSVSQPAADAARTAPEGQLRQGGRALLLALYTALRSLKLYPVENATVQKALDDLDATARALLAIEADLEIRLAGDFIFVNATRLRLELDNYASFSHILAMLRAFEIGALRIHSSGGAARVADLPEPAAEPGRAGTAGRAFRGAAGAAGSRRRCTASRSSAYTPSDSDRDTEQAKEAAKRVYSQGVAVTKDVITGARLGRATSVKRVKRAVQLIVDQVLNNETSLVGLTTIRDYDEYTFTHSVNVCIFSVALGKKLGFSRLQLYDLGMTALLHDVGKARVPIEILNKTTGLDEREWRIMQGHPWLGALTLFAHAGP